jgi:LacI family transcriptional regulator
VFTPVAPEDGGANALRKLKPAGVIAHIYNEPLRKALVSLRRPVVNVCGVLQDDGRLPRVGLDDDAIGRAAAGHLIDCGLRNFAFAGHPSHVYSTRRESGFGDVLAKSDFTFSSFHESRSAFDPRGRLWALDASVRAWLVSLPRPVGLFACNDIWGVQLTEACRQAGLRVPEDVALVGVDDDDLLCELARPSLSSVAIPAREVGRRAAALLDRMLRGGRPPGKPVLLPPRGVVTRQSSDIVALDDTDVSAAVAVIRARAHEPFVMDQMLEAASVCRRTLERRFRRALGRSIWDEIRRVRIERAKRMLSESDEPMSAVAAASGFTDGKHLCVAFGQALGATPTRYRNQFRAANG